MMINYTSAGEIIRGSRWPAWDGDATVTITLAGGWPAGAGAWTWTMRFSRAKRGGTPDLILTATSSVVAGNDMILKFSATDEETASLPGSDGTYNVDIHADNAGDLSVHDATQGTAHVRSMVGQV